MLKSLSARSNKYMGFNIPPDNVIKQYVTEMLLENYIEANLILSKHYDIFPASIDTEDNIGDVFVRYDFVNHRILFNLTKLSELELRIPALIPF